MDGMRQIVRAALRRPWIGGSAVGLAAVLLAALAVGLMLPSSGTRATGTMPDLARHGPLDGARFVGTFGPEGEHGDLQDALHFQDGHFWSENCVPCGFAPAVYWVTRSEEGIHFRGRMESPEAGQFTYEGVVAGGRISVRIHWRKERWYWTIDRVFRFEGEAAPTSGPPPSVEAAWREALDVEAEVSRRCDPQG